jgi:hypothetical protein
MKRYTHFRRSQLNGVVEVDLTGAVFLTNKSLYKNAKYSFDQQGEDAPFCRDIQKLGEKIYCNCDHRLAHCMNLELLELYKQGKFNY